MSNRHIDDSPNIVFNKKNTIVYGYTGPSKEHIAQNDFNEIQVPKKHDSISKKLCEFRCARRENQDTFAKLLGISKKELNLIESGKSIIDNNKLQQLNNKLNKIGLLKK